MLKLALCAAAVLAGSPAFAGPLDGIYHGSANLGSAYMQGGQNMMPQGAGINNPGAPQRSYVPQQQNVYVPPSRPSGPSVDSMKNYYRNGNGAPPSGYTGGTVCNNGICSLAPVRTPPAPAVVVQRQPTYVPPQNTFATPRQQPVYIPPPVYATPRRR